MSSELNDLCAAVAAGDDQAAARLCELLAPAVRTFARRRMRSPQSVDDFSQDALIRILSLVQTGAVDEPERLASFALGVCRNLLREDAKRRARRDGLWALHAERGRVSLPVEPVMVGAGRAHLEDCLSRLTERARQVLRRSLIDDQDSDEVGSALGLSKGNVRVIRHRTLKLLRECLGQRSSYGTFP